MEEEKFLTGYCRQLDASRMVEVILEQGRLQEADCAYDACPYRESCTIGQQIRAWDE